MSDKKFLIHVCVEVAIIAAVTFWLYSKIGNKDETIARLEKENQELKQRVDAIEHFLRQLTGQAPPAATPQNMPATKRKHSPTASKDQELSKSSDDEEIEV